MKKAVKRKIVFSVCLCLVILSAVVLLCSRGHAEIRTRDTARDFDVIVAGGEPEGIAAAIAAAQNDMKVLLICEDEALGGLMTIGELNVLDLGYYYSTLGRTLVNKGFFQRLYMMLGNSFDVEAAREWFLRQVQSEKNITLMLNTELLSPLMDGNAVYGIRVRGEDGEPQEFSAWRVVDATADADIAAAAGVPYSVGTEDYGGSGYQAVTLIFELSGVDKEAVRAYIQERKKSGDTSCGINDRSAWGYGAEALQYVPQDSNLRLRGPNIGFQENGNVLINALLICGVNALDEASYAEGIKRGMAELPYVVEFMRASFPGFENCELVRTADKLYVRETRHIYGEYRLTISDVLENRDFEDKIACGAYPVDIQPVSANDYGTVVGNPTLYGIPYRCIVPLEIENLLVVGRCASYNSLPHGSARTLPIGITVAEAAGVAASISVKEGISPREMCFDDRAIAELQKNLRRRGAYLPNIRIQDAEITEHWAYEGMKVLRSLGMVFGGYDNEYHLDDLMGKDYPVNVCRLMCDMLGIDGSYYSAQGAVMLEVTNKNLAYFAAYMLLGGQKAADYQTAIELLEKEGVIEETWYENFGGWDVPCSRAEVCYILGRTYNHILGHEAE